MFGLSSLSPSEIGDVEMDHSGLLDEFDNVSTFSGSPEWTTLEVGSPVGSPRMMSLSASFLERSEAELREVTH